MGRRFFPEEITWKRNDLIHGLFIFLIFFPESPSQHMAFPVNGNLETDI
jgi:hypothetical protein